MRRGGGPQAYDSAPKVSIVSRVHRPLGNVSTDDTARLAHFGHDLRAPFLLRYRKNTGRSYDYALCGLFGEGPITEAHVRRVTVEEVNRYIVELEERGLAPATIRGRLTALREFYGWLRALGVVWHNPTARELTRRVTPPGERFVDPLTAEEARALIDGVDPWKASAERDRALITTMLYACLRRGEAVALDFEHVREMGGYWIIDIPESKGGPDQYVKAAGPVVAAIASVRAAYGFDSGPVFRALSRDHYGRRLSGHSVYTIIEAAARRAKLEKRVHPHLLRHSGCTLAFEGGASLQQVQTHARHKSVETTLRYVHQRDRIGDNAVDYISIT